MINFVFLHADMRKNRNGKIGKSEFWKPLRRDISNSWFCSRIGERLAFSLLSKGEQERRSLEGKQTEQQNVVNTLQKEQKTIQNIIAQQKKKDAALNVSAEKVPRKSVGHSRA